MNTKKIKELENTIKQIQKQIEELKREDETPKFEYPRIGQTVWMINEYGNVDWVCWTDTEIGKNMVHLGMIFFTKEEVEFEVERRKVIAELKLFAEPKDTNWKEDITFHSFINYDYNDETIVIDNCWKCKHNDIYFATKEDCQKAIDFVGANRVKKYYLKIKDE